MAGLTLESALFAAIVLIALLSIGFASQPASAIPLLVLDDASSYKGSESAMIETRLGVARRHADKAPGRL
jgi:hypothetical protein